MQNSNILQRVLLSDKQIRPDTIMESYGRACLKKRSGYQYGIESQKNRRTQINVGKAKAPRHSQLK